MKLKNQKHGTATRDDLYKLADQLTRMGYTVRVAKEKPAGTNKVIWFVEILEGP